MKQPAMTALNEALNEAFNAESPMQAHMELFDAVATSLGYCGSFRVSRDPEPPNPRDGVNLSVLHLRWGNNQIGDYGALRPEAAGTITYIRPIYVYDHSGLVVSAKQFNCNFDSGQAGHQYVTKATLDAWGLIEPTPADVEKLLDQELKDYNRYLSSDGYWIVQVLGDEDRYNAQAEDFNDLLNDFSHPALDSQASKDCLLAAWEQRNEAEIL